LLSTFLKAEELHWTTTQGEIELALHISPPSLALNELLDVHVQMTYPDIYQFDVSQLLENLTWHANLIQPQWEIVEHIVQKNEKAEGYFHVHLKFIIAPLQEGTSSLSLFKLNFASPNKIENVWTPIFDISVTPATAIAHDLLLPLFPIEPQSLIDLNVANRNAIFSPEQLTQVAKSNTALWRQKSFPWLFILVVTLGSLAYLLWKYFRNKPALKIAHLASPRQRAMHALVAIRKQNFPQNGQIKTFYISLSQVMRHYLEEQFLLFSSFQTTPEFLQSIEKQTSFSEDLHQVIAKFFMQADAVKFAHVRPTLAECEMAYQEALRVIAAES
jgi:hypothetical protein